MKQYFQRLCGLAAVVFVAGVSLQEAHAQTTPLAPEDSFASENAVLDTSILFAIGAREARQELRGAFGWPTFQEGLVEGVYFRFDPDGYARFAPTPRLDIDVFEVICRPRTHTCVGRKGALQVALTSSGQAQLQIDNTTDADTFAISEGIQELQLPPTILQPLDARLEILLASGGELVIRRGDNEVNRISLKGLSAVITYLRWVSARQDYTVLPRGWPVPNSTADRDTSALTQPSEWSSPMPQPQVITPSIPAASLQSQAVQTQTVQQQTLQPQTVQPQAMAPPVTSASPAGESEMAEIRGAIGSLRDLLQGEAMEKEASQQMMPGQTMPGQMMPGTGPAPMTGDSTRVEMRVKELQMMADQISHELAMLRGSVSHNSMEPHAPPAQDLQQTTASSDASRMARHLEYLMTEVGLSADVALMLVRQQTMEAPETSTEPAQQSDVVDEILNELRAQVPPATPKTEVAQRPNEEYQLLTDYFRSVTE